MNWMITKVLLMELALLLMAMIPVGLGLGVSGVIFEADVSPGDSISHEMTVSLREGEMPLDLVVRVEDWNQSIDGVNQPQEEMAGQSTYSARSFLKAEPSKFHIDPGESRKIVLRGDVPLDVGAGGRYALIGIYSPHRHLQHSGKGRGGDREQHRCLCSNQCTCPPDNIRDKAFQEGRYHIYEDG